MDEQELEATLEAVRAAQARLEATREATLGRRSEWHDLARLEDLDNAIFAARDQIAAAEAEYATRRRRTGVADERPAELQRLRDLVDEATSHLARARATVRQDHARRAVSHAMTERGWGITDLAEQAGVDAGTIGDFLRGERWPRKKSQGRIENALGWEFGSISDIEQGNSSTPLLRDENTSETVSSKPPASSESLEATLRFLRTTRDQDTYDPDDLKAIDAAISTIEVALSAARLRSDHEESSRRHA